MQLHVITTVNYMYYQYTGSAGFLCHIYSFWSYLALNLKKKMSSSEEESYEPVEKRRKRKAPIKFKDYVQEMGSVQDSKSIHLQCKRVSQTIESYRSGHCKVFPDWRKNKD